MAEQNIEFDVQVEAAAHQVMPPQLRAFEETLKSDRKKLLQEADFEKPEQLRQFVGQYLYPRMRTLLHLLVLGNHEAGRVALLTGQQLKGVAGRLEELKHDADAIWEAIDEIDDGGGITVEDLDQVRQALFALKGAMKKIPDSEKEIWAKFQGCLDAVKELEEQIEEEPEEEEPDAPALPVGGET